MQQAVGSFTPVSALDTDSRAAFIWRVYGHVAAAILGFAAIEVWLYNTGLMERIGLALMSAPGGWLLVLGAFMLVGWAASHVAHTVESKPLQYLALGGFVVAEAIIFTPLLYMAIRMAPGIVDSAAGVTLLGVAGLTAVAFITRKDFSFLRSILMWGFVLAMIAIVGALLFGFQLGTWFSVAMIGFAGAAVLYDTSNILHHYPEDKHVGAALGLFASIALMFWYMLQLFMAMSRN